MKRTSEKVVRLVAMLLAVGIAVGGERAPSVTAMSSSQVKLVGIQFYSPQNFKAGSCRPKGRPTAAFPDTIAAVDFLAIISGWHGRHVISVRWYRPDASYYFRSTSPATFNGKGNATFCSYLWIFEHEAQAFPGTWKLTVSVDGRGIGSGSFRVIGPDLAWKPLAWDSGAPYARVYRASHSGGTDRITNAQSGVSVTARRYTAGRINSRQERVDGNWLWVWVYVKEKLGQPGAASQAQPGTQTFNSSPGNFNVTDSSGQTYAELCCALWPLGQSGPALASDPSLQPGQSNAGWIAFKIPATRTGTYTLLWTEPGVSADVHDVPLGGFSIAPPRVPVAVSERPPIASLR